MERVNKLNLKICRHVLKQKSWSKKTRAINIFKTQAVLLAISPEHFTEPIFDNYFFFYESSLLVGMPALTIFKKTIPFLYYNFKSYFWQFFILVVIGLFPFLKREWKQWELSYDYGCHFPLKLKISFKKYWTKNNVTKKKKKKAVKFLFLW